MERKAKRTTTKRTAFATATIHNATQAVQRKTSGHAMDDLPRWCRRLRAYPLDRGAWALTRSPGCPRTLALLLPIATGVQPRLAQAVLLALLVLAPAAASCFPPPPPAPPLLPMVATATSAVHWTVLYGAGFYCKGLRGMSCDAWPYGVASMVGYGQSLTANALLHCVVCLAT